MDRNRKLLMAILSVLVLSTVIAILNITITMQQQHSSPMNVSLQSLKTGDGIAVVRIDGPIRFAGSQTPFGVVGGAEGVLQRLDAILKDEHIKGVVLRINSPGGTVAATQEIYQKVWKLRKKHIPVIASIGEMAASGGYYIASACDEIMANHGSITGSIGVILMSPNLKKVSEKLGISMNIIKSGKYKDVMSSFRDLAPGEREFLQELIDSSYEKFLKDIALGRNQNISDIRPYADGRIFSGEKALKLKLIDKLGTFDDALVYTRKKANLPEDAPVYDGNMTPIEQLLKTLQSSIQSFIFSTESSRYSLEYR